MGDAERGGGVTLLLGSGSAHDTTSIADILAGLATVLAMPASTAMSFVLV